MASRREQHLKKVALEGFGLIDEFYGQNSSRRSSQNQQRLQTLQPSNQNQQRLQTLQPQVHQSHYQYFYHPHQQSYVCQAPKVYTVSKEPVTNYHGTSQHQFYNGGWSSSDEGHEVSVAKEFVVSSKEAAQFYGGAMITDYSKNKPSRSYY